MGYELNKLMQQYGVSTPTMSGPPMPPAPPIEPVQQEAEPSSGGVFSNLFKNAINRVVPAAEYAKAKEQYDIDKAAYEKDYPELMRKYGLAQNEYNKYRQDYMNRLSSTPMYTDAQFKTGLTGEPVAPQWGAPLAGPTYGNVPVIEQPAPQPTPSTGGYFNRLFRNIFSNPAYSSIIGAAEGGSVDDLAKKYAVGGEVDTDEEEQVSQPIMLASAPTTTMTDAAPVTASPAARPVAAPVNPPTPVSPAATDLMSMLERYSGQDIYGTELRAARTRVDAENQAFQKMIADAMKGESGPPDKTEMYFRLAAAFGAPTKTGHFAENLGLVGKELGDYAKDVRAAKKADRQLKLQLGLEAQKLKMQGAKEDLTTLRGLAGEEMKDRREILKEYIKSGQPQSEAGKIAQDAGLKPGTSEYSDFVKNYVERKLESGDLYKQAMLAISQGNLALRQDVASRLSPTEIKLKTETEDKIAAMDSAMNDLREAYSINPETFGGTLAERAQFRALEETGSKDPRVLNTRRVDNLLGQQALAKLKATFGGNPTEGERAILLELEGIGAKTKEQRAAIIKRAYRALKSRRDREALRLNDISKGAYRATQPTESDGGLD